MKGETKNGKKEQEKGVKSTSMRFYGEQYDFIKLRYKEIASKGYMKSVSGYFSYLVDKDISENPETKSRSDSRLDLFRLTQKRRKALYGKRGQNSSGHDNQK